MSRRRRAIGDEDGFTLVEMLITMTLAIIVLFAILGASDVFTKGASVTDKTTAAQDSARATVRGMVTTLRQGRIAAGQTTPIPVGIPTRGDLRVATFVTSATNPDPGEVKGWVRYCSSTSGSTSSLVVGVRAGDADAAPGACSAADTTNGWTHGVVLDGTLRDPTRLFDFTSSVCTGATCLPSGPAIQSVGVRVAVGISPTETSFSSVVRDAVSFRNRSSI